MSTQNSRQHFNTSGLEAFIREDDRLINPFFVGRDRLMNDIVALAQHVDERRRTQAKGDPAEGLMPLLQGPPGIGKTSLLREIEHRCLSGLTNDGNAPRIIPLVIKDPKELSRAQLFAAIQSRVTAVRDRIGLGPVRRILRAPFDYIQSAHIMGTGIDLKSDEIVVPPRIPKGWVVLLMLDEIQMVDPDPKGAAAAALIHLEGGSGGLPILPVLAGLSNSRRILDALGLSRIGGQAQRPIKKLGKEDVAVAVARFVRQFNITASSACQDRWSRILYRWSKGWPKHMQNGLAAIGEKLLETDGKLDQVNVMSAQKRSAEMRTDYYRTRFGPWDTHPDLLGTVLSYLGHEPVAPREVEQAIQTAMQSGRWPNQTPPDDNALLRLGLIDEVRVYASIKRACPIPSLHSFAVAHTGSDLHIDIRHGDPNVIADHQARGTDMNTRDVWNRTPLHLAAQDNWPDNITTLLDHGAELDATDQWGHTALHMAAQENAEEGLQALLEAGASVHATTNDGETPLHLAAREDNEQAVTMLLDHDANPRACNHRGQKPAELTPPKSASRRILTVEHC